MLTPLHRVTDREKLEKYLFLPLWKYWKFTHDRVCPYDRWVTVKRWTCHYALFSEVSKIYRTFLTKDSERNTSAITVVTKSSMKPWHGAIVNRHLRDYGERKRTQRRNKNHKGSTMMHTLKLLWLQILGWSDGD